MSTTVNVALVPRGVKVDPAEVSAVAAALSIQITRDFTPIWGISATVAAFHTSKQVPIGYWPIYIEDPSKMPPGAGGVHLDKNKHPYALIETGDQWSLDASHECLEMLVDPPGSKVQANPMLPQAVALGQPNHSVQYVVEVCDPIEDAQYAYQINGVLVSDFITPHFYDPIASAGVRYDFTGAITGPRQVLTNGYISWIDPVTNDIMQLTNFQDASGNPQAQVRNLSENARFRRILEAESLRPAIDRGVEYPSKYAGYTGAFKAACEANRAGVNAAAAARSARMTDEVDRAMREG